MQRMWTFIHKLGSPPWFFAFSGTLVRWLLPVTVLLLALGACWGLLVAPPDFRQGNSYRIIYIHVPAAVVALAGYYVMAIAGAISLIWRIKMADVAMRAAAPVGAGSGFGVPENGPGDARERPYTSSAKPVARPSEMTDATTNADFFDGISPARVLACLSPTGCRH